MEYLRVINKGPYEIEFNVDGKIFKEPVVLKAMYELVDKVYMFIQKDGDNYKVLFKLKPDIKEKIEDIVNSFGEELVFHRLRYDLDKKYGKLKEKIIETALGFGLTLEDIKQDLDEVMEKLKDLSSNQGGNSQDQEQQKSIDEIIAEIENDPDFQDDKDEIISILKEIEEEEQQKDN